ncbi:MAG TPA: GxxExxY protein [Candidatus Angelobacter sp.]|jgi:GxxExxY protein
MNSPQINADERRYKHSELTEQIIGIFYEVYNELGSGFLEKVYEEAMAVIFKERGINFQQQVPIPVWFHGQTIGAYDADLVVNGVVLLELKACRAFDPSHEAQLLHYLRSTEIEVGLLFNFGPRPQVKRFAFENQRKKISVHLRKSAAK